MKKIIAEYQNLTNYSLNEQFDFVVPPKEMVELLKEYIPIFCCLGTNYNTDQVIQFAQSEKLEKRCVELSRKILEFDFYGNITFKINQQVLIVRIYQDEFEMQKSIEFLESSIVEYEYEYEFI